ncbi:DNA methyltransferase [Hyphomicrobium sp.]|uniref:site-specific DNA-methyltransferase n=1 Tax=Hyphomicrobium sp. TaxID=82 RepID=UPI0025C7348E|nr:DNA methyltransferase [Hyphomicrobium sp.]
MKAAHRNARTHSAKQIRQIADSIDAFGFVNPVLIDAEDRIVAGHGRVEAARKLGLATVPVICLDHLTEAELRAYAIADNRLAELSGWDKDVLAIELADLVTIDSDFDVSVTGFDHAEIDLAIQRQPDPPDVMDELPKVPSAEEAITRVGTLWCLGEHRIICGDVRDRDVVARLMDGDRARMVFTDPPYNVPIDGHVSGLGRQRHKEFAVASGEMSPKEFTEFLEVALGNLASVSSDGSLHYVCMDWRHLGELTDAGKRVYAELKNLCVWNKTNGGMGSFYRSKHELVFVYKLGRASHTNNIELGRFGRYRSNVWEYAGVNTWRKGRDNDLSDHPTVKPVLLVADAIQDASNRGDIVLDGFGGAGTTLMAAEKVGRRARVIELEPRYVDVTVLRWQKLTGQQATDAVTSRPFSEIQAGGRSNSMRKRRSSRS